MQCHEILVFHSESCFLCPSFSKNSYFTRQPRVENEALMTSLQNNPTTVHKFMPKVNPFIEKIKEKNCVKEHCSKLRVILPMSLLEAFPTQNLWFLSNCRSNIVGNNWMTCFISVLPKDSNEFKRTLTTMIH